eukprot:Rmarinus@m.29967
MRAWRGCGRLTAAQARRISLTWMPQTWSGTASTGLRCVRCGTRGKPSLMPTHATLPRRLVRRSPGQRHAAGSVRSRQRHTVTSAYRRPCPCQASFQPKMSHGKPS